MTSVRNTHREEENWKEWEGDKGIKDEINQNILYTHLKLSNKNLINYKNYNEQDIP